jgi:hypothetical protein
MNTDLSPLARDYVDNMNEQRLEPFLACFAADAVVHDESQERRGAAAIAAWITEAWRKYAPILEVRRATEEGAETILAGVVSGTFEGSPLEINHRLAIRNGKIVELRITA